MTIAATPVPLSEAKARLSELSPGGSAEQHERITLTRNGEPDAVLIAVEDLEGLEMTLEILGDTDAIARISESLAALGRSSPVPTWPPSGRTWLGTERPEREHRTGAAAPDPVPVPGTAGHRTAACQKRSQQRSLNSATPPLCSIRIASVNLCSARSQAVTGPAAAPAGSSAGSTRLTAPSTSSTSITARRSTTGLPPDRRHRARPGQGAASLTPRYDPGWRWPGPGAAGSADPRRAGRGRRG